MQPPIKKLILHLLATFILFEAFIVNCNCNDDASGFTPEQLEKIEEFRKKISGFNYPSRTENFKNTSYASSWLAGFDFDTELAVSELEKAFDWRWRENINGILEEEIFPMSMLPYDLSSTDNDGRPVLIVPSGKWDLRKIALSGRIKDVLRYNYQMNEITFQRLNEIRNETGKDLSRAIAIFDLTGFNLKQHGCPECLFVFPQQLLAMESYYRGYLKHLIIINMPRTLAPLLQLHRPATSRSTNDVVEIYGVNRDIWKPRLLSVIPEDQLPIQYGGRKEFSWFTS